MPEAKLGNPFPAKLNKTLEARASAAADRLQPTKFAGAFDNPYGYPIGPYAGLKALGNVDPLNRPTLHNQEGSYSTSSSATQYDQRDGSATIFPTVIDGKRLDEQAAWLHYLTSGEHMGKFQIAKPGEPEPKDKNIWGPSEAYSQMLHEWQAAHYDQTGQRIR